MSQWQEMYIAKRKTIPEVMATIPNGAKIMSGIGNAQPQGLLSGLSKLVKEGNHKDLYYFNTLAVMGNLMLEPAASGFCHYRDAYITANVRPLLEKGLVEYMPTMFSDGPVELSNEYDIVFQTVSPMDEHGYFSMGLEPDYTHPAIRSGKISRVIFEVNEKFPRTCGNNYIHISEVDSIVEHNWDLISVPAAAPSETDVKIAEHIAKMVPNGACLQLGIGGTPNAIGMMLEDKKDLGIHSEMICDAFLHLYKKGAINNSKKNFMPYRGVGTFVFGSKELYEWVTMNPGLEMWGADFVNDPRNACKNDNLIAVNGIVEADLNGQCVSEEMNGKTYSGLGGQQDFTLAAYWSNGGKSFLTLAASRIDKEGKKHSNILAKANGTIGMSRWNTHYIVTEFGVASIKGRTIPQRVKAMIKIADPDFRDELAFEAKTRGWLR